MVTPARPSPLKCVEYIEREMRELRWVRGKSIQELAESWDLHLDVVKRHAAEASRRIQSDLSADYVREDVAMALRAMMVRTFGEDDRGNFIASAKTLATIAGAIPMARALREANALSGEDEGLPEDPLERAKALRALAEHLEKKHGK